MRLGRSIRSKLVVGVAVVHAVLMTLFITDLVHRQRSFMRAESSNRALGLAEMVAVNSVSWVLANDVRGLAEVMGLVRGYPDVLRAMVLDPRGQVLGHTDETKLGLWTTDEISRGVLLGKARAGLVVERTAVLEAAAPIMVSGNLIGWARVAIDLRGQASEMRGALMEGLGYTIMAIVVGTLFALWIARPLTSDLIHLGQEAERLSTGQRKLLSLKNPSIEVARLETAYRTMAETIWRREDELVDVAANLKASKNEIERFTEVLAHHLQEPVRLQYTFSQRLERSLPQPLSAEASHALGFVMDGALRLRMLLRDVLMYLAVGQTLPPAQPCSADAALDRALATLAEPLEASGAVIERQPLPSVVIDSDRLAEVFTILIDNAVAYRRPDTPPRIRITARSQGTEVIIAVDDNGMGISPEFRSRVFQVFERLNPADTGPGTGIGLALAKKIVETARGRIWLEASEGEGTSAFLALAGGSR